MNSKENTTFVIPNKKLKVGVVGATGYVGQRLLVLLDEHSCFEVGALMASARSAGLTYIEAVGERWRIPEAIPERYKQLKLYSPADIKAFCADVDFVFCAVDMSKEALIELEESIAREETPVISNNSANRWTPDVPLLMPEINRDHLALIDVQKRRLHTKRGFICVKPNCSIQSYVSALTPLMDLQPEYINVASMQAVSGAGRRLEQWPEMQANIIPYISGEENKSEAEPLRIWGHLENERIILAEKPLISAQCYRVPVQEGHTAAVWVKFKKQVDANEIILRWHNFEPYPQRIGLPSAPRPLLRYLSEDDRPQAKLDASNRAGMGISIGRLREDPIWDYKFVCLSHNTLRGASGGSVLTAELLLHDGYLRAK